MRVCVYIFLTVLATLVLFNSGLFATTIYVDSAAAGENTGASWGNAYTSFDAALLDSAAGDQIWVANGIHKPGQDYGLGGGPRYYHFRMVEGVEIYGGFSGTETHPSQRELFGPGQANETVLSGDLNGNDVFDASAGGYQDASGDDNCYHVFYHPDGTLLTGSSVLDGFTITGGNANSQTEQIQWMGGGMYNYNAAISLVNVTFTDNYSWVYGAGLYNDSSSLTISNSKFYLNLATFGSGICNIDSSLEISNSTFDANYTYALHPGSTGQGAGIYNEAADLEIIDCVFSNNVGVGSGGAIFYESESVCSITGSEFSYNTGWTGGAFTCSYTSPTITNTSFTGNYAQSAGGALFFSHSSADFIDCEFDSNSTDDFGGRGGVVFSCLGSDPQFINSNFVGNSGSYGGVSSSTSFAAPNFLNCLFIGNFSSYFGGVIFDRGYGEVSYAIANCTFYGNSAPYGGAVSMETASIELNNCILWGNTAQYTGDQIYTRTGGQVTLNYSCYSNSTGDITGTGSVIVDNSTTQNPGFVDAPNGDYRLYNTSAAVNTGLNSYNTSPADFRGEDRIQNANIDMGAYEWTAGIDPRGVIYVNSEAGGALTGLSWTDAYNSLHTALNVAINGDQIWIAAGIYTPEDDNGLGGGSQYKHFRLGEGVKIYGGFYGNETSIDQRNNYGPDEGNETILCGDHNGDDVFDPDSGGFQGTTGDDNSYHVIYNPAPSALSNASLLDGLTIRGGNASGVNPHDRGAAIYLDSCSPRINAVAFYHNSAANLGGAVYTYNDSSIWSDVYFTENLAAGGGAMYNRNSNVELRGAFFSANHCTADGGALATHSSSPQITNASFSSNSCGVNGGAIIFYSSTVLISPSLSNVSISNNQAGSYGGGIRFASNNLSSSLTLNNSIVWGNSALAAGNECSLVSTGTTTFNYSCYQNQTGDMQLSGGTLDTFNNNITQDPRFVDPYEDDLRLIGTSEAINTGLNSYNNCPVDIRGNVRIQGAGIDMGAYEWTLDEDPRGLIFVDDTATGAANGTAWTDAFPSLQAALDVACFGDQIWVAGGIYKPQIDYEMGGGPREKHFRLKEGVEIYGGFSGTETSLDQRADFGLGEANETVLSGDLNDDDMFDVSGGGFVGSTGSDNCYHVIYIPSYLALTSQAVLDGFIIRGGNANGTDPHNKGGAIYILSSSPQIRNVVLMHNFAASQGGAVYLFDSDSILSRADCLYNVSARGGAMFVSDSGPSIHNALYRGNKSSTDGGAIAFYASNPSITNAVFSSNSAVSYGGALDFAALFSTYTATCNNLSFLNNHAGLRGGAVHFSGHSSANILTINNSIIYGNTASQGGNELALHSSGTTILNYSCYKNQPNDIEQTSGNFLSTNNNINSDPLFVDPLNDDLRLYSNSGAVDAGLDSYNTLDADIRGQARFQGSCIDMGAYEWTLGIDPECLFPPQDLSLIITDSSPLISWTAVDGATHYRVYRSSNPHDGFSYIGTALSESFSDTGAVSGTAYFYYVTSANGPRTEAGFIPSPATQTFHRGAVMQAQRELSRH